LLSFHATICSSFVPQSPIQNHYFSVPVIRSSIVPRNE
jgi:hypothetical protein